VEEFLSAPFWVAVGQIILIDLLLGCDNAVMIALACRQLPQAQRAKGILWGTAGAVVLRVILVAFALTLLRVPYLKLAAGLLLVWIGVRLLAPAHRHEHEASVQQSNGRFWSAVRVIIMADMLMSIENVLAIAGAAQSAGAHHQLVLVTLGLLASIPIIVWSSQWVLRLMNRFAFIIVLGGMLLGWIAGGMIHADPGLADLLPQDALWHYGAAACGALLVLALGWMQKARRRAQDPS